MLNVISKIVKKGDYLYGVCSNHPNASPHGYVLLHRLVAENQIQRRLTSDEVVHHRDHNTKNNDPHNLEVMTRSAHQAMHSRERRIAHLTHGTLSSYRYCKCNLCRAAKSEWMRVYHQTHHPQRKKVPPDPPP